MNGGKYSKFVCIRCHKEFGAFRGSMSGILKLCKECIGKCYKTRNGKNYLLNLMCESDKYTNEDIEYYKRLWKI